MTYLLALSSLLSRLLGILRNNRFADVFGAGEISDAYFAAFQIPDLIYGLIIYGAISAAFVPIFTGYLRKKKKEEAWLFTNAVLNTLLCLVLVISVTIYFTSPFFLRYLYPGFSDETLNLTLRLMRIMLLSPIFFSFSAIFGSIQNSFHNFIFYSLAPVIYNLSIIFGIVFLSGRFGIFGVAYGVAGGAFLHALIQVPIIFKFGYRYRPLLGLKRKDFRKMITISIPRIFGIAVTQINFLIEGFIASLGIAGGLTMFRYAQDLQSFPIGIVGLSVAISSFAFLAELATDGDEESFVNRLSKNISNILFLVIPAAVGIFLLRFEIVRLILRSGAFQESHALLTANILGILCISLFAASLTPLLSRAFYALHNTKTPVLIAFFSIIINAFLGFFLARKYGISGLAIANVISILFNLTFLSFFLRKQFKEHKKIYNQQSLNKIILASAIMVVLVILAKNTLGPSLSYLELLIKTLIIILIGATGYFITAHSLKSPEIREIRLLKKLHFFGKKKTTD